MSPVQPCKLSSSVQVLGRDVPGRFCEGDEDLEISALDRGPIHTTEEAVAI